MTFYCKFLLLWLVGSYHIKNNLLSHHEKKCGVFIGIFVRQVDLDIQFAYAKWLDIDLFVLLFYGLLVLDRHCHRLV